MMSYRDNQYIPPKAWRVTQWQKCHLKIKRALMSKEGKHLFMAYIIAAICYCSYMHDGAIGFWISLATCIVALFIDVPREIKED